MQTLLFVDSVEVLYVFAVLLAVAEGAIGDETEIGTAHDVVLQEFDDIDTVQVEAEDVKVVSKTEVGSLTLTDEEIDDTDDDVSLAVLVGVTEGDAFAETGDDALEEVEKRGVRKRR